MPVVFTSLLESRTDNAETTWARARLGKTVYAISQTPQVCLDFMVQEDDGSNLSSIGMR